MDRDELLAAASPAELFGDALGDALAVRRTFAKLAKRFRPTEDPEASAHLRQLYEAAREAPQPAAEPDEDGVVDESLSPTAELEAAHESGSLQRIFDAVIAHHRVLADEAPGALQRAVFTLFLWGGPHLGLSALDLLQGVIEDPSWDLDPRFAEQWSIDLATLRQLRAARDDEAVPEALLDGVCKLWREPPHKAAAYWLQTAEALEGVDLDPIFEHLELHHPAVLGLIALSELQMNRAAVALNRTVPNTASMSDHYAVSVPLPRTVHSDAVVVLLCAIYAAGVAGTAMGIGEFTFGTLALGFLLVGPTLLVPFGGVIAAYYKWLAREHARRQVTAKDDLADLCRAAGAFPAEVVNALASDRAPGSDPFPTDNGLFQFDAWPSATLRTITQAHVDRLVAAAEAADAD